MTAYKEPHLKEHKLLNTKKPTLAALQITRFIAAFCVVAYHYGKTSWPFNRGILNTFIQNGGFAVSYFFALSGFIMMYAYYNEKIEINKKEYWIARIARIYPVYFLSFLLVLICMFIFKNSKTNAFSIVLHGLCMQAWKPGISMEINYVSWSIAVELLFYFVFPFILNYWRNKSLKIIILQAVSLWVASLILHVWMAIHLSSPERYNLGQFIAFFPPWHLNSFVLGAAAAIVYLKKLNNLAYVKYFSQSFLIASIILIYFLFIHQPIPMGFLTNGGMIPVFLFMIIGLALNKGFTEKILSLKPLVWLGEISYGFYLWQFFIFLLFEHFLPGFNLNFNTTQFYLYIISLLSFSAISYHIFEVPIRNYIKLKFKNSY